MRFIELDGSEPGVLRIAFDECDVGAIGRALAPLLYENVSLQLRKDSGETTTEEPSPPGIAK